MDGDVDLKTKARYCAADVLARAEHGPDSAGVLVTDSMELATLTKAEIEKQYETLSRQKYIKEALSTYSALIVTANMKEAIDFTNQYSPEHLEVLVENPEETLGQITNAGFRLLGLLQSCRHRRLCYRHQSHFAFSRLGSTDVSRRCLDVHEASPVFKLDAKWLESTEANCANNREC